MASEYEKRVAEAELVRDAALKQAEVEFATLKRECEQVRAESRKLERQFRYSRAADGEHWNACLEVELENEDIYGDECIRRNLVFKDKLADIWRCYWDCRCDLIRDRGSSSVCKAQVVHDKPDSAGVVDVAVDVLSVPDICVSAESVVVDVPSEVSVVEDAAVCSSGVRMSVDDCAWKDGNCLLHGSFKHCPSRPVVYLEDSWVYADYVSIGKIVLPSADENIIELHFDTFEDENNFSAVPLPVENFLVCNNDVESVYTCKDNVSVVSMHAAESRGSVEAQERAAAEESSVEGLETGVRGRSEAEEVRPTGLDSSLRVSRSKVFVSGAHRGVELVRESDVGVVESGVSSEYDEVDVRNEEDSIIDLCEHSGGTKESGSDVLSGFGVGEEVSGTGDHMERAVVDAGVDVCTPRPRVGDFVDMSAVENISDFVEDACCCSRPEMCTDSYGNVDILISARVEEMSDFECKCRSAQVVHSTELLLSTGDARVRVCCGVNGSSNNNFDISARVVETGDFEYRFRSAQVCCTNESLLCTGGDTRVECSSSEKLLLYTGGDTQVECISNELLLCTGGDTQVECSRNKLQLCTGDTRGQVIYGVNESGCSTRDVVGDGAVGMHCLSNMSGVQVRCSELTEGYDGELLWRLCLCVLCCIQVLGTTAESRGESDWERVASKCARVKLERTGVG